MGLSLQTHTILKWKATLFRFRPSSIAFAVIVISFILILALIWKQEANRLTIEKKHATNLVIVVAALLETIGQEFIEEEGIGTSKALEGLAEINAFTKLSEQGYAYKIWRPLSSGESLVIVKSAEKLTKPVEKEVATFDGTWIVSLSPKGGWHRPLPLLLCILAGLVFCLVTGLLVNYYMDLHRQREELTEEAFHDTLTKLPNRNFLHKRMQRAVENAENSNTTFAICYLDIDNLKPVNDTLGHQAGDLLLKEIAQRFLTSVKPEDTVSRIGGDEFIIILEGLTCIKECDQVLQKLLQAVSKPVKLGEITLEVTVSIGVSFYQQKCRELSTILDQADQAMYHVKKQAKGNNYYIFNCDHYENES